MTLLPVLDLLPGPISFVPKTPEEVAANLTPLMLDVFVDGICLYGESYFEPLHRRAVDAVQQAGLRRKRIGDTWTWRFVNTELKCPQITGLKCPLFITQNVRWPPFRIH
jgi:hypothetical protein